ncbi:MAG: hypothetical protein SangKO_100070 [Sandaracinaceae bacterium]
MDRLAVGAKRESLDVTESPKPDVAREGRVRIGVGDRDLPVEQAMLSEVPPDVKDDVGLSHGVASSERYDFRGTARSRAASIREDHSL